MDLLTSKALALLITPPGVIVLVVVLGFLIQIKWTWLGNIVIAIATAALFALSLPFTGKQLLAALHQEYKPVSLTDAKRPPAEAIVILGGGRYASAPEYDGDTVNEYSLERLRYGARLHRATGAPILVSGGSVFEEERAEAELMAAVLEQEFSIKPKWLETRSRNTYENATESQKILSEAGVRRVYLVTHAWHMPRAEWSFVHAGLNAVPAPMGFTTLTAGDRRTLGYFPSARGLYQSSLALRERLGLFMYKSRYEAAQVVPALEKKPAPAN
jgi:uncharacterized SAM-binding protein YcdF (DUF218 family)